MARGIHDESKFSNWRAMQTCLYAIFVRSGGDSAKVLFIPWQASNHVVISMRFNVDRMFALRLMFSIHRAHVL